MLPEKSKQPKPFCCLLYKLPVQRRLVTLLRPTYTRQHYCLQLLPGIEQWFNCDNMLLATHNMAKSLLYTGQHCCRQLATVASNNVAWCMLTLTCMALRQSCNTTQFTPISQQIIIYIRAKLYICTDVIRNARSINNVTNLLCCLYRGVAVGGALM